ncbi:MAG: TRC40/GET3/ArsA family transport-energizing ATPase [Candidatus Binatia bacterium]
MKPRIILYTGKGGVGKTTIAAATALWCARLRYRTLVMSTDPAHSLADAIERPLGPEPVKVKENLWAQEINVLEEIKASWGEVEGYLTTLFSSRGLDDVVAEEMAVLPGMEELCSLLQVEQQVEKGDFDCVIVDCAPTGETLRLLSFPDVARWYMEKFFPWERRIFKTVGPIVQPFTDVPLPRDNVFAAVEFLFHRIERMKQILSDAKRASVRIILNPEKIVIKESQRALAFLNLYGYLCDAVICNRLFGEEMNEGYFKEWGVIHNRYRREIKEMFAPLPVWTVHLFEREVVGLKMLERMGETLFARRDPTNIHYSHPVQWVERKQGNVHLKLRLPFLARKQISLIHKDQEILITIGNFRRNIFLPRALAGREVGRANLSEGVLDIEFTGKERRREHA